jgi:hypothetical protein
MRPILGGNVPPRQVIGRDALIDKMWRTLETSSIVLSAERRIGKTSVLRKMIDTPREGWHPVYLVVEGVRSPAEFIRRNVDEVAPILSRKKRMLARLQEALHDIAGAKLGDWALPQIKDHWKRLLDLALTDIRENFDERVVFLWDELPLMISNIKKDHGAVVAMELLDVLRDQRVADTSGKLRMVFTGSVGLHLVISELVQDGYRNDPTNDMATSSLGGLEIEDAMLLGRALLRGLQEGDDLVLAEGTGEEEVARAVAEQTDGLPFYIHHAFDRLAERGQAITLDDVSSAVESLIDDPEDPAHFQHYAERIEAYYVFNWQAGTTAYAVLDALSHADEPMSESSLQNIVATRVEQLTPEMFKKTLNNLLKDHYLIRERAGGQRVYRFRYDLIRRWWAHNRA